jgi:hypothetical protein
MDTLANANQATYGIIKRYAVELTPLNEKVVAVATPNNETNSISAYKNE